MTRVFLIDDDVNIRNTLSAALKRRGFRVDTAGNIKAAGEKAIDKYDVILLDVMLPDGNGVDFLRHIVEDAEHPPVVMMSGVAGIETAVESIRMGAVDFLEKPLSLDRVMVTIENVLKAIQLKEENRALSQMVYGTFIGESSHIKKIKKEIETTAGRSNRFLILGENGTGKELVARMIHERSRYSGGRFVPVNCAALPSELIESELFGHIKGSFTGAVSDKTGRFAEADRGTIFLDEIGDMRHEAQAKILRILEGGELRPVGSSETVQVELNVVAATNQNILELVDEGKFRQDLFYRLNVVTFNLPPLRDRPEDIPALFNHFLQISADRSGRAAVELTPEALDLLLKYHYPGNVRELRNIAERISIYVTDPKASMSEVRTLLPRIEDFLFVPLKEAVDGFEADYIQRTIDRCGGNMAEAARKLGLERSHLYKKIKKLNGE